MWFRQGTFVPIDQALRADSAQELLHFGLQHLVPSGSIRVCAGRQRARSGLVSKCVRMCLGTLVGARLQTATTPVYYQEKETSAAQVSKEQCRPVSFSSRVDVSCAFAKNRSQLHSAARAVVTLAVVRPRNAQFLNCHGAAAFPRPYRE